MASSTYKSFLMVEDDATYTKVIDIKDYPDLGGEPEMVESTTLSDGTVTNEPGIERAEAMPFTANYDETTFDEVLAHAGTKKNYSVWFGGTEEDGVVTPSGDEGKFNFTGKLSAYVAGGGVNAIREIKITIARSSKIVKASV